MYSGVMGLKAAILKSKNDGVTRVRMESGKLARSGNDGVEALSTNTNGDGSVDDCIAHAQKRSAESIGQSIIVNQTVPANNSVN